MTERINENKHQQMEGLIVHDYVDLRKRPQEQGIVVPKEPAKVNISGDMHGNALKMLFSLMERGIIDIEKNDYEKLVKIYKKIPFYKVTEDNLKADQTIAFLKNIFPDSGISNIYNRYKDLFYFEFLEKLIDLTENDFNELKEQMNKIEIEKFEKSLGELKKIFQNININKNNEKYLKNKNKNENLILKILNLRNTLPTSTKEDFEEFKSIIESIIVRPACVIWQGDTLGDRGRNDSYNLFIENKLIKSGVNFSETISNHNNFFFDFIREYIENRKTTIQRMDYQSLMNFKLFLLQGIIKKNEVNELLKNYKKNLKLLTYLVDHEKNQIKIIVHAPIEPLEDIKGAADQAGINFDLRQHSLRDLCKAIDDINRIYRVTMVDRNVLYLPHQDGYWRFADNKINKINEDADRRIAMGKDHDFSLETNGNYDLILIHCHTGEAYKKVDGKRILLEPFTSGEIPHENVYNTDTNIGKNNHYLNDENNSHYEGRYAVLTSEKSPLLNENSLPLLIALEDYAVEREKERIANKPSGYGYKSVGVKIEAAGKLQLLLKGFDENFTDAELKACFNGKLGKLVKEHSKALPDKFKKSLKEYIKPLLDDLTNYIATQRNKQQQKFSFFSNYLKYKQPEIKKAVAKTFKSILQKQVGIKTDDNNFLVVPLYDDYRLALMDGKLGKIINEHWSLLSKDLQYDLTQVYIANTPIQSSIMPRIYDKPALANGIIWMKISALIFAAGIILIPIAPPLAPVLIAASLASVAVAGIWFSKAATKPEIKEEINEGKKPGGKDEREGDDLEVGSREQGSDIKEDPLAGVGLILS